MSNHIKMVVFLSIGLLIVFGWHFATVFGFIGTPPQSQTEFFLRIGVIFVAFLALSAVTATLISAKDESEVMPDEREEKIELKAERNGSVVVYLGLLVVMWLVFTPLTPMQTANAILGVVCVAELIKIVSGLLYLKKGV